jgi:transposase-like protein
VVVWIDGKTFAEDTMVVAMGLTMEGRKTPLGIVQAGTENKKVLMDFLRGLVDRGLKTDQGLLFVVDGGKGLLAALKEAFREKALIQRCQWHKRGNVVSYLPKSEQDAMRSKLQKAYEKSTYGEARSALLRIRDELRERNLSAASSLEEGLEETLTLHRIGVFEFLGKSLKTSNCIESVFSQVERKCRKICHWKNSSQKIRWLATCLLDMERRMRKIAGYKHLPLLREKIKIEIGLKEISSVA